MTPYLGTQRIVNDLENRVPSTSTILSGTRLALEQLLAKAKEHLPEECLSHVAKVNFSTANTGSPYFPSPLKQTEAISALKAVEAGVASAIADLRKGPKAIKINVDLERATAFLFSTYLATVGGMDKPNPRVKKLLKGRSTEAQWYTYR
jgi:hypothetical protein